MALMQPRVLRLRRLVISSADRFPRSRARGTRRDSNEYSRRSQAAFEPWLIAASRCRRRGAAAEHFVGMLFWIPVNKAMFTGDDDYAATHDLVPVARTAAAAFMNAYGIHEAEPGKR